MWQSDEVLQSRTQLLGLVDERARDNARAQRRAEALQAAREELQAIRATIWCDPLPGLQERLGRVRLGDDPDLRRLAERLQVLIDTRARLPELTQHPDFNGDFFVCFKTILTGTPRESAAMRERVGTSFDDRRLAKKGRRMVKLLRRELPELCEIEGAWLTKLEKKRNHFITLSSSEGGATTGTGAHWNFEWRWYHWLLVVMALRVLRSLFSGAPDE